MAQVSGRASPTRFLLVRRWNDTVACDVAIGPSGSAGAAADVVLVDDVDVIAAATVDVVVVAAAAAAAAAAGVDVRPVLAVLLGLVTPRPPPIF